MSTWLSSLKLGACSLKFAARCSCYSLSSKHHTTQPYQLSRNPASQLQLLHLAGPVITTDPRTHGLKPACFVLIARATGLTLYPVPYVQGSVLVARRRGFTQGPSYHPDSFSLTTKDIAQKCPGALY